MGIGVQACGWILGLHALDIYLGLSCVEVGSLKVAVLPTALVGRRDLLERFRVSRVKCYFPAVIGIIIIMTVVTATISGLRGFRV